MKAIRAILFALLMSLLFGLAVGTWLRLQLEQPVRYLGMSPALSAPAHPGHIGHARAVVLEPCDHEEQVREAVQVADGQRVERLFAG